MHSRLFRRETARHLRACSHRITEAYLDGRFTWIDAFSRPSRAGLLETVSRLADAVEADDAALYSDYTATYLEDLIAAGIPPIATLAAGDLFHEALRSFLTVDQRELIDGILDADQRARQAVVYERVMRDEARGA